MNPRPTRTSMASTTSHDDSAPRPDSISSCTSTSTLKPETDSSSLEERRRKKREQDRLCQRRKREKDRSNLRRLEARLNGLQTADESKTVLDLILRHEQDQAKIDRQVERLRQLQSLLQEGLSDLSNTSSGPTSSSETVSHSKSQSVSDSSPEFQGNVSDAAQASTKMSVEGASVTPLPLPDMFGGPAALLPSYSQVPAYSELPSTNARVPPTPTIRHDQPSTTLMPTAAQSPWVVACHLFERACTTVRQIHDAATADSIDEHILIVICLHGWDYANTTYKLDHPLWLCLRQADDSILGTWKIVERMMGMWCMWRIFKANAQGPQALAKLTPSFLRPRPSQEMVAHRAHTDYYPWPGVRERLVFNEEKYFGDEAFVRDFSVSTRFVWPFDFTDMFVENKSMRMYQFSPEMVRRFHNLNYWSVDSAFMNLYPEFRGDVPVYDSIPPTIEDIDEKAEGDQHFHFHNEGVDDAFTVHLRHGWSLNGATMMPRITDA